MTKLLIAFVVFQIGIDQTFGQDVIPDIDTRFLARPSPEPVSQEPEAPIVGQIPSPRRTDKPVSVRLLNVTPSACDWDQPIIYDVEIRNDSKDVLTLPRTLFPPVVSLSPQSKTVFPILILYLRIGARGLDGQLGETELLYGDPFNPSTVTPLPPGRTLVIRVETRCRPLDSSTNATLFSTGIATIQVSASARLTGSASEGGVVATSNSLMVTVTRSLQR